MKKYYLYFDSALETSIKDYHSFDALEKEYFDKIKMYKEYSLKYNIKVLYGEVIDLNDYKEYNKNIERLN